MPPYLGLSRYISALKLVKVVLVLSACLFCTLGAQIKPRARESASINEVLQRIQPFFEQNKGQRDSEVLFASQGNVATILLKREGLVISTSEGVNPEGKPKTGANPVELRFVGASANVAVEGIGELKGKSNYFRGPDAAHWITQVPHFESVRYRQIYPGIDLVFYFKDGHLEYDFTLSPGAEPKAIRLRVSGAKPALSADGEVIVRSAGLEIGRSKRPSAYLKNESARPVPARYRLRGAEVGFNVYGYDRRQTLVIDPALAFATFLNCVAEAQGTAGCGKDGISDIAVDNSGIYLAGGTSASFNGFVIKLDPTGSQVLYRAFIPSASPGSVAVDSSGEAFIIGGAFPGFSSTPGAFSSSAFTCSLGGNSCTVPFAAKFSSDGSQLLYATLLEVIGQTPRDPVGTDVAAVDSQGNLYIVGSVFVGEMHTPAQNFFVPTTAGSFQPPGAGGGFSPQWVMKLNPAGSGLVYSTFLTIQDGDHIFGIAADGDGATYVTGQESPGFPTTPGSFQPTATSGGTPFLAKLNPTGTALVYSTFFGSSARTNAGGVAVDPSQQAVIVGSGQPPTTAGALCQADTTNQQGFIAKFNAAASALIYSTVICKTGQTGSAPSNTQEFAVAVDGSGAAYALGVTGGSDPANQFPLLTPVQSYVYPNGPPGSAPSIIKLDTNGNEQFATFLGSGLAKPFPAKILVDGSGAIYVFGSDTGFPITPNALNPQPPGNVLAKIVPSLGAPVAVVSPLVFTFPSPVITGSSASTDIIVGNFGDASTAAAPVVSITAGDFSQTNNCSAAVAPAQKCDIQVVFKPTALGTRTATLTVSISGFPDQTVSLSGTAIGPVVGLSPALLTFPPEPLNTSSSAESVAVSNSGTATLTISNVSASGDFSATNTCGSPIGPGGNCSLQVTFTPTASGKRTGTVTLTDNALDSPQTVSLIGFSGQSAGVSLSASSLSFGGQIIQSNSSAQTLTITNIGNLPLNVSNIVVTGDFTQTNNCVGSAIAPNGTCTAQVTFSPTAGGARGGTLTITDNSYSSPETVGLSGTGLDFTFAVASGSQSTATISAGQTASYTLSVASTANASGNLSFSCQGAPTAASCVVNPSSVAISNTAQNITVNVSTTARSSAVRGPGLTFEPPGFTIFATGLLVLMMLLSASRKRTRWILGPAAAALLLFVGCGGGNGGGGGGSHGTPAGTYPVTVTASSAGGTRKSVTLTLNVN